MLGGELTGKKGRVWNEYRFIAVVGIIRFFRGRGGHCGTKMKTPNGMPYME
jgi:hypothetical protein